MYRVVEHAEKQVSKTINKQSDKPHCRSRC